MVSGRPTEVAGVDSMVGLLINTVPVRATIEPTTTTADLLDQLHKRRNQTLEHEHLGLNEIHRITGQERLFDTVFVYENYPTDTAILSGADGLAVTDVDSRDYYHYPLTIQAVPGNELDLRIQYRTDVFDEAAVEALIEQFNAVLVAMTSRPVPAGGVDGSVRRWASPVGTGRATRRCHPVGEPNTTTTAVLIAPRLSVVDQILADIYAQVLGVDHVGIDESFFDSGGDSLSAMRAIAAINTALGTELGVSTLFDAPTVRSLSRQLGGYLSSVEEVPAVGPTTNP